MLVLKKNFHSQTISIETGRVAKQANGAVLVSSGDSVVLVTACLGPDKDSDFLPLTIDYVEKTYAAGKIPGGFFKREGKLSEKETLNSRLIDRPCRPLFPEGFCRDIQVVATVLSADGDAETDVLAVCGASAALTISDIPFDGPIAGVRVARIGGKLVINPAKSIQGSADLNFIVAGTRDAIVMVEGGALEASEADVLEALFYAHKEMQVLIDMQEEMRSKVGKPKIAFSPPERDQALVSKITDFLTPKVGEAVRIKDKLVRRDALGAAKEAARAEFVKEGDENAEKISREVGRLYEEVSYNVVRRMAFDNSERIDGRDFNTVRPISIEVGFLPRTHGSSLFTRGETQAIVATTLGVEQEAQIIDSIYGEERKRFMLHYNFPPFSVGEVKMMRGPGRREIGHGALAERALSAVIPPKEKFPYVVRIVSEITESNGSSSMASVCGGALSLMDAGVPIIAPVAGVAMGLMKEGDKTVVLTDILGDEDHLGDMDFKICGTQKGVTAVQMDIKIKGLERGVMTEALERARVARLTILEKMIAAIAKPREDVSTHAPRIVSFKISTDRIRDVIGPGGKIIRSITESHGVKMEVADDGTVTIASNNRDRLQAAVNLVKSLTAEAEVGKIYRGVVKRIADFGAFVEILPGVDGLVHISQLSESRVNRVTDVVNEGDEVTVKVLDIDRQGKVRLSLKDAITELAGNGG